MNIFDQLEHAPQQTRRNPIMEMSTSGYIQMSMEQELPIFTKSKKDFSPADRITHVAISNKFMVIAMANGILFRMNLSQPNQQEEISISKYINTNLLTNLFLDPYGNHLLISFSPRGQDVGPELLYLSRKSNKLKSTVKFKGHEITQVAWNYNNESENSTGPILLGTSKGLIFETEIVLDGQKFFTSGLEQYFRQVFDLDGKSGKGNMPITGLEFFNLPGTNKYIIFATTPNRLYFFSGTTNNEDKPLLQQVFNKFLNVPETQTFKQVEQSNYSRLKLWSENLLVPNSLAWLTQEGIYCAKFDSYKLNDIDDINDHMYLIEYPKPSYNMEAPLRPPFSLVLTEFHVLIAYIDAIKGISILNSELIYEDNYNEAFGSLINIVKDHMTGTIWSITENTIFRFRVTKEERNVWQIYSDKQQFDLAKKYSIGNEAYYNQVLIKEANMLFDQKKYTESAIRYAETQSSFEEICLKYIQINNLDALKIFLKIKLEKLSPQEKTQTTMIVLWLIELYLDQIEEMRLLGKEQTIEFSDLHKEFEQFLIRPHVSQCIQKNKSSIYDLMASHGDKDNSIKLKIVNKDFEQLIQQHIYKNSFREALDVLKGQDNRELFYQFAPILIQEVPKHVVKALIDQGRNLMPVKLLPALVSCDGEMHCIEIIKYLEFCVNKLKCTEKAVHNLLFSLYAKFDEKKLEEYIDSQGQTNVSYDVYFALRLCQEKKLTAACVKLSAMLGLWESAVDLAFTIDKDLAISIANMPRHNDIELGKKLWLKIAKHVLSGKDDIQTAMEFLQQCDLIRIEDILPFFSDFVTIDHFKNAICESLEEYNQRIDDLKEEMEEATKSAELVRKEIQSFRNKFTFIRPVDKCEICEMTLMIKPFYMFPCNHRFHNDCLLKELNPMLGPAKRNKLVDLQRQLNILNAQTIDNISTGSTGMSARDIVKSEIDNIVASECLYCGENMIRNIDLPFFEDNEYESIQQEWE